MRLVSDHNGISVFTEDGKFYVSMKRSNGPPMVENLLSKVRLRPPDFRQMALYVHILCIDGVEHTVYYATKNSNEKIVAVWNPTGMWSKTFKMRCT